MTSAAIFVTRRRLIFGGGGSGGLGIEKGTNPVMMIARTVVVVVVAIVVLIVVTIVVVTMVVSFRLTRTNLLRERICCFNRMEEENGPNSPSRGLMRRYAFAINAKNLLDARYHLASYEGSKILP